MGKCIYAKEFWNRLISVSENDWVGFDTIDEILSEMPAADVVEVVRCKDCKHYKTMFCKMDIWHKDITLYRADENDFCSYGERKDG